MSASDLICDPCSKFLREAVARGANLIKWNCPECGNAVMMRHFFSVKKETEVDECPACAGFWLDAGELRQIRSQFESEQGRKDAARRYFEEVFGDKLAEIRAERDEETRRVRRIANMFRFICPSYYIPGKQKWGAF